MTDFKKFKELPYKKSLTVCQQVKKIVTKIINIFLSFGIYCK